MGAVLQVATLGQGAYSSVFSAKHIETGEQVAVKDVIFHNQKEGVPSTSIREVPPSPPTRARAGARPCHEALT